MRKTIFTLITLTLLGALAAAPAVAAPSGDSTRYHAPLTQTNCVEVLGFGNVDMCMSRTLHHRHARGWVQTSARLWTPDCDKFESPNQAAVAFYYVVGVSRNGNYANHRYIQRRFNLNGCSNTDTVNHVVKMSCMQTTVSGLARLNNGGDKDFRLNLSVGPNCPETHDEG